VSTLTAADLLAPAYDQARLGLDEGGVPVGAALWIDGRLVAGGRNRRVQDGNPILHGETHCLQVAGRLPARAYRRSTLATTLSPCDMCTGAILLFGIPRVIVGENRTFLGGEELLRSRGVEVIVVDDAECASLMRRFIAEKPEVWNEDISV
jgi:cytosine deaminase